MNKELSRIINESGSEELCEAQRMIATILDARRNKAKADAWDKVTRAIKEYVITFGDIEVEADNETVYLTAHDCYSQNGRITIDYEID